MFKTTFRSFNHTSLRTLHFKLKGFHDSNLLKQARLRIKARAIEDPPVWFRALELSPPRQIPPKIKGKLKKLKILQSPAAILGNKASMYMKATQAGRDTIRGFGGNQNFEKQFTIRQMKLIRDGTSEKEAFDQVHEGMEEELETYRINIEEAYSTIVEAEGGTSLSDFVNDFTRTNSVPGLLPTSAIRAGPKDIAFMRALEELGFVEAMKQEKEQAQELHKSTQVEAEKKKV